MNLLFKRGQTSGVSRKVTFNLWVQTELDDDEKHIVQRYKFDSAKLIDVFQPNLMRISIGIGLAVFAAVLILLWNSSDTLAMFLGLGAGIAAGYFYFDRHRESVMVRDLIHGRSFTCDSVVDLARKEAWLGTVVSILRQVMETAKHWDGTETVKIEALTKAEAKFIALKGI